MLFRSDAPELSPGPRREIQEVSRVGAQGVTSKSKLLAQEMPWVCSTGFAGRFQGGSAPAADADAGADASDISYKADKRRRNREAAVRFRKNRKLRDDKIRSELEDLRNREKDWRKREEDWRAREAALQADKDRLQSRVGTWPRR